MSDYIRSEFSLSQLDNNLLYGTFYHADNLKSHYKGTIIYFHGGGLIFGEREDLPSVYIELLTQAGYGVLAVDYLLAPESKLDQIISSTSQAIQWFFDSAQNNLNIPHLDYYLMGRSAGGFLAIYQAVRLSQAESDEYAPKGLISFYGYFNLNEAAFNVPSRHFLQYPKVTQTAVRALVKDRAIVSGPMDERYPVYMAARQEGNWKDYLLADGFTLKDYSLTNADLKSLPPTFITAATNDPDVPVRQSKLLHKSAPESVLHLVESDEHDFDRTQVKALGLPMYEKLVEWLDGLVN